MGRYPKADRSEPNSPTSSTASGSATLSGCSENDDWKYPVQESQQSYQLGELVVGMKLLSNDVDGELVVGTKCLLHDVDRSYTGVIGTHPKEITRPISKDQGYGTQELATAVHSGLLGSCEPNPNFDEEESQGVDDRPINITDELQNREEEGKVETETTQSSQQLDMLLSCPSDPGTLQYTSHYELAPPTNKPPCIPSSNSSTEHRLKLLDTGQPPGEYNSTSEDMWCSECSPSESPRPPDVFVGAPVLSSLSVITPPCDSEAPFSVIMPACYFWDSEAPFEDNYKIPDVRPFYSMAGPEENQTSMKTLITVQPL